MKLKAQQMSLLKRISVSEHCNVCDFDGTSRPKSRKKERKINFYRQMKNKTMVKNHHPSKKKKGKKDPPPKKIKNSFTNGKDLFKFEHVTNYLNEKQVIFFPPKQLHYCCRFLWGEFLQGGGFGAGVKAKASSWLSTELLRLPSMLF